MLKHYCFALRIMFFYLLLSSNFITTLCDNGGSLINNIKHAHRATNFNKSHVIPHVKGYNSIHNFNKNSNGSGLYCGAYVGASRHIKPHCIRNDSYCGEWHGRRWQPLGCEYRDITNEQARKCMAGRTLAFIGDSQTRDLGVAVGLFLIGQSIDTSPTYKFDKKGDSIWHNCTKIGWFHKWGGNGSPEQDRNRRGKGTYNGYLFPKHNDAVKNDWTFQVQVWELFANEKIQHGQMDDVLGNKMIGQSHDTNETLHLKPLDLAFWNHGLHDYGWFDRPPYGLNYFNAIVKQWIEKAPKSPTPLVWLSMNPECRDLIVNTMLPNKRLNEQVQMVEECNWYVHKRLREERRPYFDAAALLRSHDRCSKSCDG